MNLIFDHFLKELGKNFNFPISSYNRQKKHLKIKKSVVMVHSHLKFKKIAYFWTPPTDFITKCANSVS